MKSQIEWLEAVRSGDESRIIQAQIHIAARRAGLKTPSHTHSINGGTGTPAPSSTRGSTPQVSGPSGGGLWAPTPRAGFNTAETPAMTPLRADSSLPSPSSSQAVSMEAAIQALAAATGSRPKAPLMGLDAYLARTTSEDNADFSRLISEEQSRKRIKYKHHLEDKNRPLLLKSSSGEEFGTSGQLPMTLAFKHVALNSLMYTPDGVKLTDRETEERSKGQPKKILAKNTRLASSTVEDPADTDQDIAELFGAAVAGCRVDCGQEGQHGGITGSLARRLASPSFTPGPQFSPIMTWGQIESTPLRLDAAGPFKVQDQSKRDKVHRLLVDSQSKNGSIKKQPSLPMGFSPHQGLGLSSRQPHLSPAAHSLAAKLTGGKTPLLGGRDGGVNDLRASYSGQNTIKKSGITPTPTPSAGRQSLTPHPS